MESKVSSNIKVNLFIPPSELEFMLQVLKAFKKKKMLDFKVVEPEGSIALEGPALSETELLKILEDAEHEPKVSHEELRALFKI